MHDKTPSEPRLINGMNSSHKTPEHDASITGPIDHTEEFVRLLGQTRRHRFAYLMSLMNDRNDVEEVLQETDLVLWRKFDDFEWGTNFTAWSCRVAFNQMRAWRQKQQRSRLQFSDEFLTAVATQLDTQTDRYDQRLENLRACVRSLPERHRQLIDQRYTDGEKIKSIATRTGRSLDAVYRMLSRIRDSLRDCVTRKMNAGVTS
ncbi:extracytoplasmic function alternative sigma factor [Rhodopirellula baltica SH28]|uniref:Extracytoplasmic function alternative sigma factor n=2 Tax=Rhodopirellula baltica TaxID=265606 RepID=K5DDU2_RHOBT|nr:extracytoplasmic function alternative sigma factor [Rhodopirellula baltica SH28]